MNVHNTVCCITLYILISLMLLVTSDSEELESSKKKWLYLHYDKHRRPPPANMSVTNATQVRITMHVLSFSKIKSSFMEFTAHFYFRQKWRDSRIRYANLTVTTDSFHDYKSLPWLYQKLWIPDTFFRNQKYGALHSVPTPNILLQLRETGDILLSQMIESTFSCVMDLSWFPMDQQQCSIRIGNYGYNIDEVHTEWDDLAPANNPVTIETDAIQVQEFSLDGIETGSCVRSFAATGTFSCIYVLFKLHRRIGFYIIGAYLPFFIITAISWTSFWLPLDALAPRTSITFITVLAVVMHNSGLSGGQPQVSGIKVQNALDIYMLMSLCCVTGALVEFAIATYLMQRSNQGETMAQRAKDENEGLPRQDIFDNGSRSNSMAAIRKCNSFHSDDHCGRRRSAQNCNQLLEENNESNDNTRVVQHFVKHDRRAELAVRMDSWSRILFPAFYVTFNAIYWTIVVLYSTLIHSDKT